MDARVQVVGSMQDLNQWSLIIPVGGVAGEEPRLWRALVVQLPKVIFASLRWIGVIDART